MNDNENDLNAEFCAVPETSSKSGGEQKEVSAQGNEVMQMYLQGGENGHLDDDRANSSSPLWEDRVHPRSHPKKKG